MRSLQAVWLVLWLGVVAPGWAQPAAVACTQAAQQTPVGQAARIPFKRDSGIDDAGSPASALAMLLVAGLAIGALLLLRKRFNLVPPGGHGLVRVLETQRLGPRALVSVVEFNGQRYLVAQSEHGVTCLTSAPVPSQGEQV